jgi:hypothetical protein
MRSTHGHTSSKRQTASGKARVRLAERRGVSGAAVHVHIGGTALPFQDCVKRLCIPLVTRTHTI